MPPTIDEIERILQDKVYHPEFEINVVDLGLIYDIQVDEKEINLVMTTPNPKSPKISSIAGEIEALLNEKFEQMEVEVSLTWEPEWNPSMIKDRAKADPQG